MLLDLLLLSIVKQNKQHKIYIMENKESQKKWSVCKIDINNGRATLISDQLTFWSFDHKCRCSSSFFLFVFSSCRWERVGAHTERERELEMRKQNNVQKWVAVLKRHKKNNNQNLQNHVCWSHLDQMQLLKTEQENSDDCYVVMMLSSRHLIIIFQILNKKKKKNNRKKITVNGRWNNSLRWCDKIWSFCFCFT